MYICIHMYLYVYTYIVCPPAYVYICIYIVCPSVYVYICIYAVPLTPFRDVVKAIPHTYVFAFKRNTSGVRLTILVSWYIHIYVYVYTHTFSCFEGEKKAQFFLPPPAGETPDPCHLSGPEMISYTFRHHTPSDTIHLGLPGGAAGAMNVLRHGICICICICIFP